MAVLPFLETVLEFIAEFKSLGNNLSNVVQSSKMMSFEVVFGFSEKKIVVSGLESADCATTIRSLMKNSLAERGA